MDLTSCTPTPLQGDTPCPLSPTSLLQSSSAPPVAPTGPRCAASPSSTPRASPPATLLVAEADDEVVAALSRRHRRARRRPVPPHRATSSTCCAYRARRLPDLVSARSEASARAAPRRAGGGRTPLEGLDGAVDRLHRLGLDVPGHRADGRDDPAAARRGARFIAVGADPAADPRRAPRACARCARRARSCSSAALRRPDAARAPTPSSRVAEQTVPPAWPRCWSPRSRCG